MLSQQFFTRSQVAKLLGFKSVGMLQKFENMGFITPEIKPSRYSLNQVTFMFICKELVDFTPLSWKVLIACNFNQLLNKDLVHNDLLTVIQSSPTKEAILDVRNNKELSDSIDSLMDYNALDLLSNIPGNKNITYENISSIYYIPEKNCERMFLSIRRVRRKLAYKCTELKINLEEKILINN